MRGIEGLASVHFIGIGGAGMSALASMLLSRGVRVTGSDRQASAITSRLQAAGAIVWTPHCALRLAEAPASLVVASAAIPSENPELVAAHQSGIEVISRAEMLGRVMAEYGGPRIAVTGTHGKTTTTAMLSVALAEAGLDPTSLIGADYRDYGGNTRIGKSQVFLTEACEAYDSFLQLRPDIAVITNVEADHLDHYGTVDRMMASFVQFASSVPASGAIVYTMDDPGAALLANHGDVSASVRKLAISASDRPGADLFTVNPDAGTPNRWPVYSRLEGTTSQIGELALVVPGAHNRLNGLNALAAGIAAGGDAEPLLLGLSKFRGAERRFELLADVRGILVVDDYAHHPTEVRATLAASRTHYPQRRILLAFQPHLYSRTRDFFDEFALELSAADVLVLTDVYAAREAPIVGVSVAELAQRIRLQKSGIRVVYVPDLRDVAETLLELAMSGDLVITMGAGDIRQAGEQFVLALKQMRSAEAQN